MKEVLFYAYLAARIVLQLDHSQITPRKGVLKSDNQVLKKFLQQLYL
jgi:hypothetical protein